MSDDHDVLEFAARVAFSREGRLWTEAEYIADVIADAYVACVVGDEDRQRRILDEIRQACPPEVVIRIREKVHRALVKRQQVPKGMWVQLSAWRGSPVPGGIAERALAAMYRRRGFGG